MCCEAARAAAARSAEGERKSAGSASSNRCSAALPFSAVTAASSGSSKSTITVSHGEWKQTADMYYTPKNKKMEYQIRAPDTRVKAKHVKCTVADPEFAQD
jgi:hypothetical protein